MAKPVEVGTVGSYFELLSDPLHLRNRKHLLVEIMVIAVRVFCMRFFWTPEVPGRTIADQATLTAYVCSRTSP